MCVNLKEGVCNGAFTGSVLAGGTLRGTAPQSGDDDCSVAILNIQVLP